MEIAILLFSSFLVALVSGAAGFGGALMLIPIATACLGADVAVPVVTIAQLIGNISRTLTGWKQIDWKAVGLFSLTSLPLAALGAFGFVLLPTDIVTRCIGFFLIVYVIIKYTVKKELPKTKTTLLAGGAVTGALSGLCGSSGPIGAAVFLSFDLAPMAYIASEACTAMGMHFLKAIIYSKLTDINTVALLVGIAMGLCMVTGTIIAKRYIKKIEKGRFQIYIAVLLCIVGVYMLISGA